MAQKLWEKSVQVDRDVERFTVGKDREMDLYLAPFDILGSLAHISMLQSIGLLTAEELKQLTEELRNIYRDTETGKFNRRRCRRRALASRTLINPQIGRHRKKNP